MNRIARVVVSGLLFLAVYFAVFGGEYSLFELRRSRAALEVERASLAEVEAQIDSLTAWADSLRNDGPTLERVAREQFGMIKDGETLYRFAGAEPQEEPDTP